MGIENNIEWVRETISRAAKKSGRAPDDIALMAVTKTIPPERMREAYQAGIRLFGENRVQEFAEKREMLDDLRGAEWHLIGHLQSNKAAKAADLFDAVNSLDSMHLAERLNAAAGKCGKVMPVLIEVNVGGEEAKHGVAPASVEFEEILRSAPQLEHIAIRGLMTVPPFTPDPEGSRIFFRELRAIRDEIAARKLPGVSMEKLSMGMSHDYAVAIEEGSTCIRLGTAIFGSRTAKG